MLITYLNIIIYDNESDIWVHGGRVYLMLIKMIIYTMLTLNINYNCYIEKCLI